VTAKVRIWLLPHEESLLRYIFPFTLFFAAVVQADATGSVVAVTDGDTVNPYDWRKGRW
jgi:hypothetical protein